MKIIKQKNLDMHISDEEFKERQLCDKMLLDDHIDSIIENVFSNNLYKEFSEMYAAKISNLKGNCILNAHGTSTSNGKWGYEDKGKIKSIQNWINNNDGKYSNLIIVSCNENSVPIDSKKSLVFVPETIYSHSGREGTKSKFEMYVPVLGYVDDYIIKHEIEKLKKKPKNECILTEKEVMKNYLKCFDDC